MQLTLQEKQMYSVMRAVYASGIPISFKGSMVLKACLLEAGYAEDTRHTVDIDANWNTDTLPSPDQMIKSLQEAIGEGGIDLNVSIFRMYGEGRSAGFEFTDKNTGEALFSMDIDVNRPIASTKVYEVEEFHFCGVVPIQILSDKISVVSSDKVFRRIKDVIDLYYLSKVFSFHKDDVLQSLEKSGKVLGTFHAFLYEHEELEHSYRKFRFSGDVDKPSFNDVYHSVRSYIKDLFPNNEISI